MEMFKSFLLIFAISLVILAVFSVLKKYVLSKIKVNKWVVLGGAIVTFILPGILGNVLPTAALLFIQVLFVIFLLWFMDLIGVNRRAERESQKQTQRSVQRQRVKVKSKKKDVIKPKAKPNRVKKD